MKNKKVIFMGTPEFAVPILQMLIENTEVILVVTQPDKEVGRKKEKKFSPIKELAIKNNIETFQPIKIKEDYKYILEKNPDIIITCAYGQIIPNELIETPKYGAINVHASLLPKLRGGAPIHHAIIDGYKKTGITIMYMSSKMDAGDIISQKEITINDKDNVGTLHDKLSKIGTELLKETLPLIFEQKNERLKQNEEEVTFGYNITREEEKIDFNKTAEQVYNQIRGLNPFPLAYAILNEEETKIIEANINEKTIGKVGKITEITKNSIIVKCKDKSIEITKIKPFGKRIMEVKDYLNGIKKEALINKEFR